MKCFHVTIAVTDMTRSIDACRTLCGGITHFGDDREAAKPSARRGSARVCA